jgi:hypothetical protein
MECKNVNSKILLGRQIWKFYEPTQPMSIALGKNPTLNYGFNAKTWGKINYLLQFSFFSTGTLKHQHL